MNDSAAQLHAAMSPDADAYRTQALSHALQGRLDEASICVEQALRLQPGSASALNLRGNILFCQRRYEEAVASYQQAVCFDPTCAEAYNNLGNTLATLKQYEQALDICTRALRLRPNYAMAYVNLGNAHAGLGRHGEAIDCYRQALKLDPDLAEARHNLGTTFAALGKWDEAILTFREAVRQTPDCADLYYNLGVLFTKKGDWDSAAVALQQAVHLQPNFAEAHYRLGGALGEQGKVEEAAACFQQALRLKPDYAEAHWALAYSLVLRGEFEQGWSEFEWRWQVMHSSPRPWHQLLWDGSALEERTILLHAEQGLGDTIQFVRYAALVKQCGGTVVVACQEPLLPLIRSCRGIDRVVAAGSEMPTFDVHAPLLSLPRIFKTTLTTIPAEIPYLFVDVGLKEQWQRILHDYPGFKIGIAWQGNPHHPRDRLRSIPLVHFAPLACIDSVRLISLQKGKGTEQLSEVANSFGVIELGSARDYGPGTFLDTAAVVINLDLVVTADTAVAHLAGALGVPVWLALPFVPDWRWLLDHADSPWYPNMRLFRQTKPGDWNGVFDRIAEALLKSMRSGAR